MALLNFNYGLVKDLPTQIVDGNLYITTDSQGLYVDLDSKRIHVSDFVEVTSEEELTALGTYSTKVFYYVSGSNALLKYTGVAGAEWRQLNSTKALNDDLTALTKRVKTNEDDISSLKTATNTQNDKISALDTLTKTHTTNIAANTEAIGKKADQATVDGIDTRLGTAEVSVSTLQSNYGTLSNTVSSLATNKADKTTVEALDGRVTTAEQKITDHAIEYTALEGRVTTAEEKILANATLAQNGVDTANAAKTAAAAAQTAADNAANAASAAQSAADAAQAKAESVLGNEATDTADSKTVYGAIAKAAAVDARITEVQSSLTSADADLSGRIDDIEKVIGGVQGAMHFIGISSTDPSAGSVTVGDQLITGKAGDVVVYKADGADVEYVYDGTEWVELGDVSAEAQRIANLETRMQTAEGELDAYDTWKSGINSDITTLKTSTSSLDSRVEAAEGKITTAEGKITTLESKVSTAEENIKAIQDDYLVQADKTALTTSIANEATNRTNAVNDLQSKIDAINARLTWEKF